MGKKFDDDSKDKPTMQPRPLMLAEMLERFIAGRRLPICMPQRPCEAAQWWINMQRPIESDERPYLAPNHGGSGQHWETPHTDRLVFNLRKFLKFKSPDQQYIIGAREDGVWWNGDEMDFFYLVVDETMLMKEMGRDAYIARALEKMRGFCKKTASAKITEEAGK